MYKSIRKPIPPIGSVMCPIKFSRKIKHKKKFWGDLFDEAQES